MATIRCNNMEIEAKDVSSDIKNRVEDQCAEAEGDTTCDSDNGNDVINSTNLELGNWMCESSDDDDEEGFEGWAVWSPASFDSKSTNKVNQGFKGLLQ